ncbi:MAG: HPP family protein [Candidatus Omnitrophica bacterium]|nr:HPP family protein [Candidatus Omnitrophota bacterium]
MLFLSLHQAVIVASLGATAFVVFATPSSVVAKARNVLGGYVVGILTGAVFTLIPHDGFFMTAIIYSLAVGLSIFIMVLTDTEHPPASGVTLGVVIQGFSLKVSLATLASIVILVLIHRVFRRYLKDLV